MRIKQITAIAALALAGVPAGALAAQPSHPSTPASTNANSNANATTTTTSHGSSANAKVMFVLHGKVTSYTAGSSLGLTLTAVSRERSKFTLNAPFTVALNSSTKVVLHDGAAVASGDMVVVKVRAAANTSPASLSTTAASQLIDQGAPH